MSSLLETMKARAYPEIRTASHGLSLMCGLVRLRIDRERKSASLVGEVHETIGSRHYYSCWTPVPYDIALTMASRLYKMSEEWEGDERGGRAGWRQSGFDGDVADWYCHVQ